MTGQLMPFMKGVIAFYFVLAPQITQHTRNKISTVFMKTYISNMRISFPWIEDEIF